MSVVPPKGVPKYDCAQSKHKHLPKVPLRMLCVGPSGSGKTVFLTALITDLYKGCFERVYVFSPSVHVDGAWLPVKKFVKEVLEVPEEEQWAFDTYNHAALEEIIDTQKRVTELAKAKTRESSIASS